MSTELHAEHFNQEDHEMLLLASNRLLMWAANVVHHEHTGQGWPSLAEDPTETARRVDELIREADEALREARRWRTEALRAPRGRAQAQARRKARP